ncbi:TetR family transcriptional regulator [Telmatobacter sp. DSM 110680]|uniref:TetR family transcriptional regulator n=1 Tax=Telmatobacter sp. DSM 110680 TaxID=3036704 RepID=A0AAU7DMZ5_9BACT
MTISVSKAEVTRTRILDVALDMFRRQGFESTTMRGIAAEAGVSLGSAYYYFEAKEDLVMAFYERAIEAMIPRMEDALAGSDSFEKRVAAIMEVKFEYFRPNRAFLGALFRHAADPQNRLSPFSDATRSIRERDQAYFARAISSKSGSLKVSNDLAPHLPKMLWLYQMGLILYWIYDRSPQQQRTQKLVTASLSLIVSGLSLARIALLKPLRTKIVELIALAEGEYDHA